MEWGRHSHLLAAAGHTPLCEVGVVGCVVEGREQSLLISRLLIVKAWSVQFSLFCFLLSLFLLLLLLLLFSLLLLSFLLFLLLLHLSPPPSSPHSLLQLAQSEHSLLSSPPLHLYESFPPHSSFLFLFFLLLFLFLLLLLLLLLFLLLLFLLLLLLLLLLLFLLLLFLLLLFLLLLLLLLLFLLLLLLLSPLPPSLFCSLHLHVHWPPVTRWVEP